MDTTKTKENVAHFDWRTVMSAKADFPEKSARALDRYFRHFVAVKIKDDEKGGKPVIQEQKCVNCGEILTGFMAMFGRGGFQWGIAHGEGHCGGCKWPATAHHFIKDEDGNDVVTLRGFILQVHPEFVTSRKDRSNADAD